MSVKISIYFFLLVSFLILIKIYISHVNNNNNRKTIKDIANNRKKLSLKLTGSSNEDCPVKIKTNSQGLLIDSVIVCDITKNLQITPTFQFENYTNDCTVNDFLFVNADTTNFKTLKNPKAPKNILCKTKQAFNILKEYLPQSNIIYTGFTSIDRYDPSVTKDYNKFIHICGKSPHKGTLSLIKAWVKSPEFPMLTVICRNDYNVVDNIMKNNGDGASNITILSSFISEEKLNHMINEFGVHICSSEHEGWGHYMSEAMSCRNIVLYTDKPPFSERIDNLSGVGIECKNNYDRYDSGIKLLSNKVSPEEIIDSVNKVLDMSLEERYIMGENARAMFLHNDITFKNRLIKILKEFQIVNFSKHSSMMRRES